MALSFRILKNYHGANLATIALALAWSSIDR